MNSLKKIFLLVSFFTPYAANAYDHTCINYFIILGITARATQEEIKKARKTKLLEYHPDKCAKQKSECNEKTREIINAYRQLSSGEFFLLRTQKQCPLTKSGESIECSFVNIDFSDLDLSNIRVSRGDFRESCFNNANLEGAKFSDTHLESTCFKNARLKGASFGNSAFENVDFTGADLRNIDFSSASAWKNIKLEGTCHYHYDGKRPPYRCKEPIPHHEQPSQPETPETQTPKEKIKIDIGRDIL